MIGKLFGPKILFLVKGIGEAKDADGNVYQMSIQANNAAPIVRCRANGVWWGIDWSDIIKLAIANGINKPWKEETDANPKVNADKGKPHQEAGS